MIWSVNHDLNNQKLLRDQLESSCMSVFFQRQALISIPNASIAVIYEVCERELTRIARSTKTVTIKPNVSNSFCK